MTEYRQIQTRSGLLQVTETGQGRSLMLVHGLFTSSVVFELIMNLAPPGVRAIGLDLPGCGRSEPGPGFVPSWRSYAQSVVHAADALGLDRFDLLGHSMGGGISILIAADVPDRVERLVLVDAVSLPYQVPLKGRLPLIPVLGELLFHFYGEKMFIDYFANDVCSDPQKLDLEKTRVWYRIFDRSRPLALAALRATANPAPVAAAAPDIRCPTLVLWGRGDGLVPLSVGQHLERLIKDATLRIIDGCGHSPVEECPDLAAKEIFAFLHRNVS